MIISQVNVSISLLTANYHFRYFYNDVIWTTDLFLTQNTNHSTYFNCFRLKIIYRAQFQYDWTRKISRNWMGVWATESQFFCCECERQNFFLGLSLNTAKKSFVSKFWRWHHLYHHIVSWYFQIRFTLYAICCNNFLRFLIGIYH